MFTSLGLFGAIPCPQGDGCTLLKCIFSHDNKSVPAETRNSRITSSGDDGPPSKRVKVENTQLLGSPIPSHSLKESSLEMGRHSSESVTPKRSQNTQNTSCAPEISRPTSSHDPPKPSGNEPAKRTNTTSAGSSSQLPPRKAPKETLNPRMLPHAPATHGSRTTILQKLHSAMTALNEKLRKDKNDSNRCFVLTPDELITMALDEEEKFARDSPSVYGNVIRLRIVKVTKMGTDEWAKEPREIPRAINTGLTPAEEIAVVSQLVTPVTGLEEHGYVTKQPTDADVETAKRGVDESKGWEKCDRCGQRFQVFPGRREDGTLASGGHCDYHPGRPVYPQRKKTDHVTGPSQPYFPCCSEALGASTGCTKANTHVFKVSEAKRLASILQFKTTPSQPGKGPLEPVSIDCEMGYTTFGLELIRLTAVSWPTGRDLLDVLVRPMGEVLDLNTRFSGVTPQHYASASLYGTPVPSINAPSADEKKTTNPPLQLVQSPAEARDLLLKLLQPETPLIGHAIDNDLNACRIIHPTIIDTVLLYPHPKGLPIRISLKALVQRHLGRDIQVGDHGHDSKEDSIATGDLVRVKVGEKWKELKKKGQKIEDGRLICPAGEVSTITSSWTTVQKRKSNR
ncbi:unnamed protein product [Penicillium crustosum]